MWVLVLAVSLSNITLPVNIPFDTALECKAHGKYAKELSKNYKAFKVKWRCGFRMPEYPPRDPEFPFGAGSGAGSNGLSDG